MSDDNVEYDAQEGDWKESHTQEDVDAGRWVSGENIDRKKGFTDSNGWTTHHTDLSSFDRDIEDED